MAAAQGTYERSKEAAQSPDREVRCGVASRPDTPAEILYFLAEDQDLEVRRSVAGNPATPRQADAILARDGDYTVRCLLARKIVGSGLDDDSRGQLWRLGFTILETLARDSVVRVRQALAEAIAGMAGAPREIVLTLAEDSERSVAEPVVKRSPVLGDADLARLVGKDGPEWLKSAAACRGKVGPKLAEAIVRSGSVAAVTTLLKNKQAEIPSGTLDRIIEAAPKAEPWHKPLVERPSLPRVAITRLAKFVSAPLLRLLRARKDLDAGTAAHVDAIAERRGEAFAKAAKEGAARARRANSSWQDKVSRPAKPGAASSSGPGRISLQAVTSDTSLDRVRRLMAEGQLTDEVVHQALTAGENEFVIAALSEKAGVSFATVQNILSTRSGRAVTALCWKAGFSMRFAVEVQSRIAHVPPTRMVYARDGEHYPLAADELSFQLEMVQD